MTADIISRVVAAGGNLSNLTEVERTAYYSAVCESVGLNPLTKPFEYIVLNGKLTLYCRKDATDQLRKLHKVSIYQLSASVEGDTYMVFAYARSGDGREDVDLGATSLQGLKGDALVNAKMKAITKAKRRATLSICGLGWLDESEVETIPATALAPAPEGSPTEDIEALREECLALTDKPAWRDKIQTAKDARTLLQMLSSLQAKAEAQPEEPEGAENEADN